MDYDILAEDYDDNPELHTDDVDEYDRWRDNQLDDALDDVKEFVKRIKRLKYFEPSIRNKMILELVEDELKESDGGINV
jgi:hypothetical protein